ncbi:MAG: type 1 glutamine amidotransferase [Betaproteobacteria bacterium]
MRPVLIVQHEADVAPGRFALWLAARGLPATTVRVHEGDVLPRSAAPYAGLCFMGGTMSVNDPLPWIAEELALIRDADARGVPVIGHCLGGQLLAKALGAEVRRHRLKEIGWGRVQPTDEALARDWLGESAGEIEVFQWHGDSFDLPPGAWQLCANPWCTHQAFVVPRATCAHLGMQFHIEMTPELVRLWSGKPSSAEEIEAERRATGGPAVQAPAEQREDLEARCARMGKVAERLYERWAWGLRLA